MTPEAVDEVTRIRSERELYLQLLELGRQPDIASFLHEALALIVELGCATRGYLELHGDDERAARWWTAHGYSPDALDGVRTVVSRGIIVAPRPRRPIYAEIQMERCVPCQASKTGVPRRANRSSGADEVLVRRPLRRATRRRSSPS